MTQRFALILFAAALAFGHEPELIPGVPAMNAASRLPTGIAGGGVAQGARFVVLGKHFAEPVTAQLEISGPAIDADVKSVGATQVEIMAPRFASTGTGWVVLNVAGKELRAPIIVLESAPGILTRSRTGTGTRWRWTRARKASLTRIQRWRAIWCGCGRQVSAHGPRYPPSK